MYPVRMFITVDLSAVQPSRPSTSPASTPKLIVRLVAISLGQPSTWIKRLPSQCRAAPGQLAAIVGRACPPRGMRGRLHRRHAHLGPDTGRGAVAGWGGDGLWRRRALSVGSLRRRRACAVRLPARSLPWMSSMPSPRYSYREPFRTFSVRAATGHQRAGGRAVGRQRRPRSDHRRRQARAPGGSCPTACPVDRKWSSSPALTGTIRNQSAPTFRPSISPPCRTSCWRHRPGLCRPVDGRLEAPRAPSGRGGC